MARCQGIKRDGGRCTASVPEGSQWCFNHDPAHANARKHNTSRAGKSRPNREIGKIKSLLEDLTNRVLEGELPTSVAAVANQLINTRLRAIEVERRVKDTEEFEARLQAVEARTRAMKGASEARWQNRR
jgi:hypothetical protein